MVCVFGKIQYEHRKFSREFYADNPGQLVIMKVELHYGSSVVSLQIPEGNLSELIQPWHDGEGADNTKVLQKALSQAPVRDFEDAIAGHRVCVLVEDGTRDVPLEDVLEQVFGLLVKSSQIRFMICTGTHNPETSGNEIIQGQIQQAARKAGVRDFAIHVHDCQRDTFEYAGQTSRGTKILFNAAADDAEVFLVLSDAKVHYFAGYSNPVKNFVPGICTFETTEQNHSLALDDNSTFGFHPWHEDDSRKCNPLAQDQLESMRLIVKRRRVFALVTVSVSGAIQWAGFGGVQDVSRAAFSVIDRHNMRTIRPVERLIVSPGGFPNDIDLYIAQRALELTKNAVTNNGEILFVAACCEGVGEKQTLENFYNRLTSPIDEILQSIERDYKLYSHKPYKFARMIQALRRLWVYSEMPGNIVEAAHMYPTDNPQAVVDNWLLEEPGVKIAVVDGANRIALYADND